MQINDPQVKKVDVFLTMTCNPNWPEIQRELRPGETSYDRPDLVARVFQMKKKALLKDIVDEGMLGWVVAHVYTIEFQKRGLPHIHLLIFFESPHKLLTPEEIDKLIWARWPDPETPPMLFETVKACMVHGPCGAANPNAPCMDKEQGICLSEALPGCADTFPTHINFADDPERIAFNFKIGGVDNFMAALVEVQPPPLSSALNTVRIIDRRSFGHKHCTRDVLTRFPRTSILHTSDDPERIALKWEVLVDNLWPHWSLCSLHPLRLCASPTQLWRS
jgi:hypothetical protein